MHSTARLRGSKSVPMSIRLSVKCWYCLKTVQYSVNIFLLPGGPIILVFHMYRTGQNSDTVSKNEGVEYRCLIKIAIFDQYIVV